MSAMAQPATTISSGETRADEEADILRFQLAQTCMVVDARPGMNRDFSKGPMSVARASAALSIVGGTACSRPVAGWTTPVSGVALLHVGASEADVAARCET